MIRIVGVRSFDRKLEFLKEAMLMADFCHEHVLALIAISIHNQKPYVILPIMEHGDLKGFVSNKDNVSPTEPPKSQIPPQPSVALSK